MFPHAAFRTKTLITAAATFLVAALLSMPTAALPEPARLVTAESLGRPPVVDAAGRSLYLIDLDAGLQDRYPDQAAPNAASRFHPRHSNKAIQMALALEREFGLKVEDMTSWVGNSISAYLTPAQIERVRRDPRVRLVTQVVRESFSVGWGDTWCDTAPDFGCGITPYGWYAVNGRGYNDTSGFPRIYVVDAGVGHHTDLTGPITRVSATAGVAPVGCYAHATMVAGIIAAGAYGGGVIGVIPEAPLISVSALSWNQGGNVCGDPYSLNTTSIAAALDWVKFDLTSNSGGRAGVVNLSISGPGFGPNQTLRAKVIEVATPSAGYVGAFVAQAAGNGFQDACGAATGNQNAADGIMVVGAHDRSGAPVQPSGSTPGFQNSPNASDEPGSNFGPCVEAWGPGHVVPGLWGPNAYDYWNSSTWQSQFVTYYSGQWLGGTSFAAPHVAGVAAYLAKIYGLTTPAQMEASVRGTLYSGGYTDAAGQPVTYVRIP